MTADPVSTPEREPRLLTVAEYLALGETELGYDELVEGRVFVSPSPGPDHNRAVFRVAVQVEPQLPPELEVLLDLAASTWISRLPSAGVHPLSRPHRRATLGPAAGAAGGRDDPAP